MLKNMGKINVKALTLIEITIALVILAILTGISFASYLLVNSSTQTSLAQASLHQVYIAESDIAGNYNEYTPDPADLSPESISGLTVISGVVTSPKQVSIAVSSGDYLGLATLGAKGTCIGEYALSTVQGGGERSVVMSANKPCDGADALPAGHSAIPPVSIK
jgi:prepilin-type N-terminal cleavage/methylation domain-containing protein